MTDDQNEHQSRTRLPVGIRDRAILATLAYSACRVGELVRLRVEDFKTSGEHRVLALYGKGARNEPCRSMSKSSDD